MFKCDKCGECCRNLHLSDLYKELDKGDVCKYLEGNLCSIYNERPLLCRVDESYQKLFKEKVSYDEYLKLNEYYCEKFKNQRRN